MSGAFWACQSSKERPSGQKLTTHPQQASLILSEANDLSSNFELPASIFCQPPDQHPAPFVKAVEYASGVPKP
jgi:hypothetical protein